VNGFTKVKLETIAEVIDSLHQTPSYSETGLPMVRVTDIKRGYLDLSNTLKVSPDVFAKFSKNHTPKKGDILFSRVGSYGNTCIVNNETKFCLGQNTAFIIPKENPLFLYYYLNSPDGQFEIESSVAGSTQPTVSLKSIKNFEVPSPSPEEKKAIASVLSSLDDKIDLLHRQNTTLERMAETLFRQWFVEEAQENWEELRLEDIASVISGYNHKQDELSDSGDYLLSMGSAIKKYGFSIDATRQIKTKSIPEKYLCHANDIFLTTRDVTQNAELLGTPGIIPPCIKQKVVLGSNLYKLGIKNKNLPISVIYFLLRSDLYREYVKEVASGTSILMLKKSDLDSFSFKVPPTSMLVKLDEILSNILSKLNVNFQQEITVKKIRDNLLPKLMSGEVRLN
jgi:type I restriction enzyme S subunit